MKYFKKFAKVINVNVLVRQIEWDLIGTAAEAQCIWFGPNLQLYYRKSSLSLIANLHSLC